MVMLSSNAALFLVVVFGIASVSGFLVPTGETIKVERSTSLRPSTIPQREGQHQNIIYVGRYGRVVVLEAKKDGSDVSKDDEPEKDSLTWLFSLVLPLWLVYISNQWSRSSLYYVVNFDSTSQAFNAMNVDIGFNEAQYGILASVAFTSLFAIASLGAGYASDRFNRRTLTVLSAASWSVATLGTALADSYTAVCVCRVAMGLACAFSTPTAYTLIRDNAPKIRIATASSLYGTGVALGSGLASLTLLLDEAIGWRQALIAIAAFGLLAASTSALLLPQDETDVDAAAEDVSDLKDEFNGFSSITTDIREAFSSNRAQWIYLGSFFRFCSGLCIGVWSAPYFRMVFSDRSADYSVTQALISAIGASSSGLLGGALADKLSSSSDEGSNDGKDDEIGRRLWVPIVGSVLAAPAWYFAVHSPESFENSMAWLAAEYFVAECWFGPTISTLQASVSTKVGGTAQGLFTMTGAIANFAPSILGFVYAQHTAGESNSFGDSTELSGLLSLAVCVGYIVSAACFGMASVATPPSSTESTKS